VCCAVCWRVWRVGSVRWRYCDRLEVTEVIHCVLLCMLEAVDGGLCLLGALEVVEVPKVMRGVLRWMLEAVEGRALFAGDAGDMPCATLYAGGCGLWVLFAGGVGGDGGDAPCAALVCWRLWTVGSVRWKCRR